MGPKACSPETLTTWEGRPGWAVTVPLRRSGVRAARIAERLAPYCFDSSSSPGAASLKSPERILDSRSSRTAAHSGGRLRGDRSSAEEERPDEVTMSPSVPDVGRRFLHRLGRRRFGQFDVRRSECVGDRGAHFAFLHSSTADTRRSMASSTVERGQPRLARMYPRPSVLNFCP